MTKESKMVTTFCSLFSSNLLSFKYNGKLTSSRYFCQILKSFEKNWSKFSVLKKNFMNEASTTRSLSAKICSEADW